VALTSERREAREDVLLGQVLLRQKFITPDHLKQAMAAQAAGVARGRKRPRRLGIILVEQGRIDDQTFIQFLREVEERVTEEEGAREEDRRLAETLLTRRVVTEDQLDECLRLQQEAFDRGDEVIHRIGEILIQEGYVKPEAVAMAVKDTKPAPAAPPEPKPPGKPVPKHIPPAPPKKPVAPSLRFAPRPKPEIPRKPHHRPLLVKPVPAGTAARPPLRVAAHPKPAVIPQKAVPAKAAPAAAPKPPIAPAPPPPKPPTAVKLPPPAIVRPPTSVTLPIPEAPKPAAPQEQAASRPDIPLIEKEPPEPAPPPSDYWEES
jgi:hypothetical protein